jgi:hypothetical protein
MRYFSQGEPVAARRDIFVQMVDESDHATPATGLSLAVRMVKADQSAYAPIAGGWLEIGDGTYRVRLDPADLDTEGEAMLQVTAAGAVAQYVPVQVGRLAEDVHLAKAALVNARTHVIDTGVDEIRDDDGAAVLRTLIPTEQDGVITITPV